METERVKISQLQVNEQNPRTCTDKQFEKLVRSVITFPKMLEVRPIVVGEGGVALGGNMRLRALQAIATMTDEEIMSHIEQSAKYKDRTECERDALLRYWQKWKHFQMVSVVRTDNMTEDERREFIIKDNVGFGAWDWDMLANAPKEVQELIEDSALVIIDFNKAIEDGFVNISQDLLDQYGRENGNGEERIS